MARNTPQTKTSERRLVKRFALAASLSALALTATASSAGAVTIGQLGAVTSPNPCSSQVDRVQPTVTSGTSYVVPSTGGVNAWTVRSWTTLPNAPGSVKMKMYRPLGPGVFTAVAQDVTRTLSVGVLNTFQVNLAVRSGDVLGLNATTDYPCSFVLPGDSYLRTATGVVSDLANGATGTFPEAVIGSAPTGRRLDITADVTPTNTFKFGKISRNKNKGNATLTVNVPNPGKLSVSGTGVVKGSKTADDPGDFKLTISAKGKKKRALNDSGKVNVTPKISFTPTGGAAGEQSRKLKLRKN
ncbi:MAG: hypothetical protein M3O25_04720 [Actinomycetota bacterium]|nr:hypothetical protein [Actinomycetota bacterium]